MPKFIIEQYELHVQQHEVEALTRVEAIQKLLDGDSTEIDKPRYISVAENSQPLHLEDDELAKLEKLEIDVDSDGAIESIRSVRLSSQS